MRKTSDRSQWKDIPQNVRTIHWQDGKNKAKQGNSEKLLQP